MRRRPSRWARWARRGLPRTPATVRLRSRRNDAWPGRRSWSRSWPEAGFRLLSDERSRPDLHHPTLRPRPGPPGRAVPAPPVLTSRGIRMKLRLLAVIGLIAIGVGAIGVAVFGPSLGSSATTQYLPAAATRENVVAQSVATGSVAASATYGLAFGSQPQLVTSSSSNSSSSSSSAGGSSSWLVNSVAVAVGDRVTSGQVLAVADTSSVDSALAIARPA